MDEDFKVIFLEEAEKFLGNLDTKSQRKIIYNIRKAQVTRDSNLLKKLTNEIWEFRTLYNRKYYRLFAFWDKRNKNSTLVVASHGITKSTAKIPKKEILKAEGIMKIYFQNN